MRSLFRIRVSLSKLSITPSLSALDTHMWTAHMRVHTRLALTRINWEERKALRCVTDGWRLPSAVGCSDVGRYLTPTGDSVFTQDSESIISYMTKLEFKPRSFGYGSSEAYGTQSLCKICVLHCRNTGIKSLKQ